MVARKIDAIANEYERICERRIINYVDNWFINKYIDARNF